jgi:hypothetical protein
MVYVEQGVRSQYILFHEERNEFVVVLSGKGIPNGHAVQTPHVHFHRYSTTSAVRRSLLRHDDVACHKQRFFFSCMFASWEDFGNLDTVRLHFNPDNSDEVYCDKSTSGLSFT